MNSLYIPSKNFLFESLFLFEGLLDLRYIKIGLRLLEHAQQEYYNIYKNNQQYTINIVYNMKDEYKTMYKNNNKAAKRITTMITINSVVI